MAALIDELIKDLPNMTRIRPVAAIALGLWLASAAGTAAQVPEPLKISGQLWGKPTKSGDPKGASSTDVSGLACAPPADGRRTCLVVDDESQGAQLIILEDAQLVAGDAIRLIADTFEGKPVELDAEAVVYADGAFYVTGSHGRPRHEEGKDDAAKIKARAAASSHVFRLRIPPGAVDPRTGTLSKDRKAAKIEVTLADPLAPILAAQPKLVSFADAALEDNGLTVEGLAVTSDRILFGLRTPVIDSGAAILSVPLVALFPSAAPSPSGPTSPPIVLPVDLGVDTAGQPRGIRDLVTVGGGLWGLAGPAQDPPKDRAIRSGDYAVFRWAPGEAARCQPLDPYPAKATGLVPVPADNSAKPAKPEGLTLVSAPSDGTARALLVFDGPGGGWPTPLEVRLADAPRCHGH